MLIKYIEMESGKPGELDIPDMYLPYSKEQIANFKENGIIILEQIRFKK